MKCLLLLLFLNVSIGTFAAIEKHDYDILLFGDKIGSMYASKELKPDGSEVYVIESNSKAKILWISRSNYSRYETVYKNGQFISSEYKEVENGKLSRWGTVKWDGKKYLVDNYAGKKTFTEIPQYTVISLYFSDVSKMKRIFYDAEANFNEVAHTDENTIEFKSSDGHRNVYHFINGILHHLEVHVSFATVKMVRVN
jgi:hypothetical protein